MNCQTQNLRIIKSYVEDNILYVVLNKSEVVFVITCITLHKSFFFWRKNLLVYKTKYQLLIKSYENF